MSKLPVNNVVLTVDPASQPFRGKPLHVQVINSGRVPLRITTDPVTLHQKCAMTSNPLVSVTPANFTLNPGKWRMVTESAPVSRGDFGVLFQAHTTGRGAISLVGAVGSQLLSGGAISCAPPRRVAASHSLMAGFPLPFVLAGALAALLVIGGLAWRRFHHGSV